MFFGMISTFTRLMLLKPQIQIYGASCVIGTITAYQYVHIAFHIIIIFFGFGSAQPPWEYRWLNEVETGNWVKSKSFSIIYTDIVVNIRLQSDD